MTNNILILTQDHSAIYSATNIRLQDTDSDTYDLYADIHYNGMELCLRVAKYKTKAKAKKVLVAIAENSRNNAGEVFDLRA